MEASPFRVSGARATHVLIISCITPDGGDDGRAIDQFGGTDEAGREWHLPLAKAVSLVSRGVQFVVRPRAVRGVRSHQLVPVTVVTTQHGTHFLRAEGGHDARLSDLPHCRHSVRTPPIIDGNTALDERCREAIAYLREHCPDVLPDRLGAGEVSSPLPFDAKKAGVLVATAVRQAAARAAGFGVSRIVELPHAVVWTGGTDSLLVLLDSVTVVTSEGLITVSVEVACDELAGRRGTSKHKIAVDIVVGTQARPTGLLAAAPVPRGDPLIVDRWGDELTALAWRAMLDTAASLTAAAGRDVDGTGLIPTSWSASKAGLSIAPQARFDADRVIVTAGL